MGEELSREEAASGEFSVPHSWQGREPQHRIYTRILPCPVGTMPGDRGGLGTAGNFPSSAEMMAVQGGLHQAMPGLPCGSVGSAAQATSAPSAARGSPNSYGPQGPSKEGSGLRENSTEQPRGLRGAGGRRHALGPHLNWGLLTRVRRAAVKAATSPCSRAEQGPAMSCLRERGGGRRRRRAGAGRRMAGGSWRRAGAGWRMAGVGRRMEGGELEAGGRPASPGRPRGASQQTVSYGTAHC